jgi:hypothetical protein
LLQHPKTGQPFHYHRYRAALRLIAHDLLHDGEPIQSHQLRHSYATSLLNAGMSLASIRQLLGHKSITMTMRYAMMSPVNIRKEFLDAISKAQEHYDSLPVAPIDIEQSRAKASTMVTEFAQCVHRDAANLGSATRARAHRIARQLHHLGVRLGELGL